MAEKEAGKKELTPQQRVERAQKEIEAVLKLHNCTLITSPAFRARDDGTFSVVVGAEIRAN